MRRFIFAITCILIIQPAWGSRLFDDAVPEYFYKTSLSDPFGDYPFVMAAYFRSDDAASSGALLSWGDGASTNEYFVLFANSAAKVVGYRRNGTATSSTTSTSFSADEWNSAIAVFTSDTSCTAYLNGGGAVEDTTSKDYPAGTDTFSIGREADSSPSVDMSGEIAHVMAVDGTWDAAEIAAYAAGNLDALIADPNTKAYWPLNEIDRSSDADDTVGAYDLTVSGTPEPAEDPLRAPAVLFLLED